MLITMEPCIKKEKRKKEKKKAPLLCFLLLLLSACTRRRQVLSKALVYCYFLAFRGIGECTSLGRLCLVSLTTSCLLIPLEPAATSHTRRDSLSARIGAQAREGASRTTVLPTTTTTTAGAEAGRAEPRDKGPCQQRPLARLLRQ